MNGMVTNLDNAASMVENFKPDQSSVEVLKTAAQNLHEYGNGYGHGLHNA